jgi:hypothetical protein
MFYIPKRMWRGTKSLYIIIGGPLSVASVRRHMVKKEIAQIAQVAANE